MGLVATDRTALIHEAGVTMWTVLFSALSGLLAKLVTPVLAYFAAREAGRIGAENEALVEQNKQVIKANEARANADTDSHTDPYLRD